MQVVRFNRRGNSFTLTVPSALVEGLHWMPGDLIHVASDAGKLIYENASAHLVKLASRRSQRARHETRADARAGTR